MDPEGHYVKVQTLQLAVLGQLEHPAAQALHKAAAAKKVFLQEVHTVAESQVAQLALTSVHGAQVPSAAFL